MNMSDLEGVKTRVCSKCKIEKPVEGFYKDKKGKDGLRSQCKGCRKEYKERYNKDNPDYFKEYYRANVEKINEYARDHYKANSKYYKEYSKEYRKSNPDKINTHTSKRRSKRLQATPPWLTKEHLSAIRDFYTESKALEKATGIKHHVDHIIPLQGKNVCGLHVPWNLQVLTASENSSKNNSYPDEWEDT